MRLRRAAPLVALLLGACRQAETVVGNVPAAYPVPDGPDRVIAEVLNGTGVSGRARAVTRVLRRRGIDVVYYGGTEQRTDSTLLLVRRGDASRAKQVRDALGFGTVRSAPDSMLRVDVTVVVGREALRAEP